jgi:hypothetical protein
MDQSQTTMSKNPGTYKDFNKLFGPIFKEEISAVKFNLETKKKLVDELRESKKDLAKLEIILNEKIKMEKENLKMLEIHFTQKEKAYQTMMDLYKKEKNDDNEHQDNQ